MHCSKDCMCTLCRELSDFKQIKVKMDKKGSHVDNENFILRRRLSTEVLNEMGQNFARKRSSFFRQLPQKSNQPGSRMTKASSYNELPGQFDNRLNHQRSSFLAPLKDEDQRIVRSTTNLTENHEKNAPSGHKVVIYFGDSLNKRKNEKRTSIPDVHHASRLLEETAPPENSAPDRRQSSRTDNTDVMRQLKSVLEEKNRERESAIKKVVEKTPPKSDKVNDKTFEKREIPSASTQVGKELPHFVESVINGVINIKIEENYEEATRLVKSIANSTNSSGSDVQSLNDDSFDWSFVQEWRTRYFLFLVPAAPDGSSSKAIAHKTLHFITFN